MHVDQPPSRNPHLRRPRGLIVRAVMAVALTLALAVPTAAAAGTGNTDHGRGPKDARLWSPRKLDPVASVSGKPAPAARKAAPQGDGAPPWRPARAGWPAAAQAEVRLGSSGSAGAAGRAAAGPGTQRAGTLPVWVGPGSASDAAASRSTSAAVPAAPHGNAATGKVAVALADRAAAGRAGVDGLLVSLTPREPAARGAARISLDYSAVKSAYGGDWAARLHLVALPACALTTPQLERCRTRTPVRGAVNDVRSARLSADLDLAAPAGAPVSQLVMASAPQATVLAADADPSGPTGDYKATSLAPTSSWSAGGSAGTFSWSYPIAVPPALGGTAPDVSLGYNSASVDGRTVSRNAQSSWIGDGWEYNPGYIERSYLSCKEDGKDRNGEACWSGKQTLTMVLGGSGTSLVQDDTDKKWRTADGSPSRIEPATLPAGVANGDNDGEYWKVTTTDGVQYYFGAEVRPGTTGGPGSHSTWTRPVFGNNTGEPCNKPDFADSWCQQAWRWNLDYVVDTRGALISYTYAAEGNHYARNPDAAHPDGTLTPYTRGGHLTEISYGSKLTDQSGPTARVTFTSAERCDPAVLPKADCGAAPTKATAASWPDVPFDQDCAPGSPVKDCKTHSPTFWSTHRLARITTQVITGGTPQTVDEWTLSHEYPSPQDGTTPSLWLSSITRTARDGQAALTMPSVDFAGTLMPNRVDTATDNRPPLNRRRMTSITSESGLRIAVAYAAPDCVPGQFPAPDANTRRCYPVFWNPDPGTTMDPTLDWFHKYVVSGISQVDATSAGADPSPTRTTRYEYVGGAAWHRDDSPLTETKSRTWNQFRGYGEVIVRNGSTQANAVDKTTQSSTVYLRGMDGDFKADGTRRAVQIPGTTTPDSDVLAGFVREKREFTGDGGALAGKSVNEPWTGPVVARRVRGAGLPDETARFVRTAKSAGSLPLSDGTWRTTAKTTAYDPGTGVPLTELDTADGLPDSCTTTSYASNTALGILALPVESYTVNGGCSVAPGAATTTAHTRNLYDNQPFGRIGALGAVTTKQVVDAYAANGSAPSHTLDTTTEFDAYGRTTKITDPVGNTTSTSYTPAVGGLPTRVSVTGPMGAGWTTTTDFATARNLPVKSTDVNNRVTEMAYDPAGRLTQVWQPGRNRASQSANLVFSYNLSKTAPSVVTTKTLRDDGAYQSTHQILDAFLQTRQIQSAPVDESPGRILTDTFYDSLGRIVKSNQPYWDKTAGPSGSRFLPTDTEVPAQTGVFYDGQGRTVAQTLSSHAVEQSRTTTSYAGSDKVSTTPPDGGVATTLVKDARGRTTEQRQYTSRADVGSDNASAFTATRFAYDARGKLASVKDPAGNTWSYGYDLLGRQSTVDDPDKGHGETRYDALGRPEWTKDARGQVLTTTYDKISRRTGLYDGAVADSNLLASWSYDRLALGRPDGSTRYVGGKTGAAYTTEITALDTGYRPRGTKVTIPAAEGGLAGVYTTAVEYTPVTGLPVATTLPAVGGLPAETVTTGLSDNGLPVTMWSEEADYVNRTVYDPFGRTRRVIYGDVPKQVAYTPLFDEATGRLTSTFLDRQTGPGDTQVTGSVDAATYTYKPSGDVTSISTRRDDGAAGFTTDRQCFTYDHLSRMTEAWTDKGAACASSPTASDVGGPVPYWQSYGFDVTGNRTKLVDHAASAQGVAQDTTTLYTSPAPGQPRPHTVSSATKAAPTGAPESSSYTYDAIGNTLTRPGGQTLTWDPEGHLATNNGSSNVYDAEGQRLLRREPGRTTLYLGADELTLTAATGKVTGTRTYAGFGGGPSIVRTATGLTYVASDHHGTATTTLDAATLAITRRAQKPYGESRGPAPTAWPDDKGFLGRPQDASGLTHVGAREYDPALGRFISVDPVMDPERSQQIHGYLYAGGNPVTNSDPTGLDYCPSTECNHHDPATIAMLRGISQEEGEKVVENTRQQEAALGIPWSPSTVKPRPTPPPAKPTQTVIKVVPQNDPHGVPPGIAAPKGEHEPSVDLFHWDPNCGISSIEGATCTVENTAEGLVSVVTAGPKGLLQYLEKNRLPIPPKLADMAKKGTYVGALLTFGNNFREEGYTFEGFVKAAVKTRFEVQYIGRLTAAGATIGGAVGGPPGAVIGAIAGAALGVSTSEWAYKQYEDVKGRLVETAVEGSKEAGRSVFNPCWLTRACSGR
ncbi:RHS repeat-associated core domain-containing protein [Streptomyces sp. NPDC096339]|uniref:RHS repeat domain-containing protein n=1 Tax=Streptomyces sp. NPDC096339 TaxID=3366086 RepID=UPI0038156291